MRDCSGNQLIGTQGELGMYRIFQREKQYFKVTAFLCIIVVKISYEMSYSWEF